VSGHLYFYGGRRIPSSRLASFKDNFFSYSLLCNRYDPISQLAKPFSSSSSQFKQRHLTTHSSFYIHIVISQAWSKSISCLLSWSCPRLGDDTRHIRSPGDRRLQLPYTDGYSSFVSSPSTHPMAGSTRTTLSTHRTCFNSEHAHPRRKQCPPFHPKIDSRQKHFLASSDCIICCLNHYTHSSARESRCRAKRATRHRVCIPNRKHERSVFSS